MNDDDIDAFLEHYGVKGMKWGRQKVQDSTSGQQTLSRRALKKRDRERRNAEIDSARERVANAQLANVKNVEQYRRDKKIMGEAAALKVYNKAADKIFDDDFTIDAAVAAQTKHGREAMGNALMIGGAVALAAVSVFATYNT